MADQRWQYQQIEPIRGVGGNYMRTEEQRPLLINPRSGHIHPKTNIGISTKLGIFILGFVLIGGGSIGTYLLIEQNRPYPVSMAYDFVQRTIWGGYDIPSGLPLNNQEVEHVIIFHTGGNQCNSFTECKTVLREMQIQANITDNTDIPYNFLISSDGETYEARGWQHQSGFLQIPRNSSLTIGFIGNFTVDEPSFRQIDEARQLVEESMHKRKISSRYKVYGMRNLSESHIDGEALFGKISNWKHWDTLINVL